MHVLVLIPFIYILVAQNQKLFRKGTPIHPVLWLRTRTPAQKGLEEREKSRGVFLKPSRKFMFEENSEREKKAVLSYLKFGIHNACYTAIMKTKESPKTINISNGFLEQISSLYRKM